MDRIKDCLERTAKEITEIIEDSDTYRIEDISVLTKLNCQVAETLLKIQEAKNGTVQTSKASIRTTKKSK